MTDAAPSTPNFYRATLRQDLFGVLCVHFTEQEIDTRALTEELIAAVEAHQARREDG